MAKVLIIEDEAGIQSLLKRIVSSCGHTVFAAGDGETGSALAAQKQPDLIITDLGLPGALKGRPLIENLRSILPGARVVIASGDQPQPAEWLSLGVTDFLNKPFDLTTVKKMLERLAAN